MTETKTALSDPVEAAALFADEAAKVERPRQKIKVVREKTRALRDAMEHAEQARQDCKRASEDLFKAQNAPAGASRLYSQATQDLCRTSSNLAAAETEERHAREALIEACLTRF